MATLEVQTTYRDRFGTGLYIALHSPKLKLVAQMAHQTCNIHGRKLLIFPDWPMTQWNTENVFAECGFNVVGIRAIHKSLERDACANTFNDPTSNLQILVTSLRISAAQSTSKRTVRCNLR